MGNGILDLMQRFSTSPRQACGVLKLSRQCTTISQAHEIMLRIKEITQKRVHYGYRRVHVMLLCQGWRDNPLSMRRLSNGQSSLQSCSVAFVLLPSQAGAADRSSRTNDYPQTNVPQELA